MAPGPRHVMSYHVIHVPFRPSPSFFPERKRSISELGTGRLRISRSVLVSGREYTVHSTQDLGKVRIYWYLLGNKVRQEGRKGRTNHVPQQEHDSGVGEKYMYHN